MKITPENGILFVDHQAKRRSGHLGHALTEYAPGKLLAFYSNCAGSRNHGHSGFGWVEVKRSEDAGQSWSEPSILSCSMDAFLDGEYTLSCEKAVTTDRGTIIVTCLRNLCQPWEPYLTPQYIRSHDGGESWTSPRELSPEAGRPYDMRFHKGRVYVLHFANDSVRHFTGNQPEHRYLLLESTDDGESFHVKSVLPFDTEGRAYGALLITPEEKMLAYAYNIHDEYRLDVCESDDLGLSWHKLPPVFLAKRIRNPQLALLGDTYFLHGRSGCETEELPFHFVLYTSKDALHWDEGRYLYRCPEGAWGKSSFYSNNLLVHTPEGERLLIQSSAAYDEARTNIRHWWISPD